MSRLFVFPFLFLFLSPLAWPQSQAENIRHSVAHAEQEPPSKAIHHASRLKDWQGTLSAGTQISRGATNVNGVSIQGAAHYSVPKVDLRLDWNVLFAEAKVPGVEGRVNAQDRQTFAGTLSRPIKGRYTYMSQLSGEHDRQKGLSYRATWLNGIGIDMNRGKRFKFTFAPGVGVTREHKNYVVNEWLLRPGFYEGMSFVINKQWIFYEHALLRVSHRDGGDSAFDGVAQLAGMINKRLGVQFTYNFNYEGKVAPGYFRSLSQLTAGIKVTI